MIVCNKRMMGTPESNDDSGVFVFMNKYGLDHLT